VSRKSKFTAKLSADLPPHEKVNAAVYGDSRDPDAIKLLEDWRKLSRITVSTSDLNGVGDEEYWNWIDTEQQKKRSKCLEQVATQINAAISTRDGAFFRAFADAIERIGHPVDPVRALIGRYAEFIKSEAPWMRKQNRTLADFHRLYEDWTGKQIDMDQFRRYCDEMELPYAKGKIGRPRTKTATVQNNSDNSRRAES